MYTLEYKKNVSDPNDNIWLIIEALGEGMVVSINKT